MSSSMTEQQPTLDHYLAEMDSLIANSNDEDEESYWVGLKAHLTAYKRFLEGRKPVAEAITPELRIAELSDQLQASQCAEKMTADLLVDAKARIAELEAGIRKWASECGKCDGKGFIRAVVTIHPDHFFRHVDRPCEACADIRALLPKESDNG